MKPTQKMIEAGAKAMSQHPIGQIGYFALCDYVVLAVAALTAALAEHEDENERLRGALTKTQIGVNHIASYRTDRWPNYGTDTNMALSILGAGQEYDMWCCWNAAMCARDQVDNIIQEKATDILFERYMNDPL
jgi:hypothetical protein